MTLTLDVYQTAAVAVFVYALGSFVKKKVDFFNKYCIPASVIGGILFAVLTLSLNVTGTMTVVTDTTLQSIFMTLFFTSVGYTASLKLLKKGGIQVLLFLMVSTLLILKPYYRWFITTKKFRTEDSCIGCGKCEKVCPLGNIRMEKGLPQWGDRCTHCMACINFCPKDAIEYGKGSVGKIRYRGPEQTLKE